MASKPVVMRGFGTRFDLQTGTARNWVVGADGCTDGGCVVKRPKGMHTNGGCRCSDDRLKARRMMQWAWQMQVKLRTLLAQASNASGTPTTEGE